MTNLPNSIEPNTEYMVQTLMALLKIPSVSGNTVNAMRYISDEFSRHGLTVNRTAKGALIATLPGQATGGARTLSAHVDTLGAMVKELKSNGRLKISPVGGYLFNSVEGENCLVETASGDTFSATLLTTEPSVHVWDNPGKLSREQKNMELRLDARVASKEDVLALGIGVGDFVSFDPRAELTAAGFIKSRHLDDKAGVAVLLAVAQALSTSGTRPEHTTHFLVTSYEEVGHGAAHGVPAETAELIAVDMGAVGEGQTSDEFSASICAKDSSGPYSLELRQRLVGLAKQHGVDYKVDIYPHYGSDVSAAWRAGADVAAGLIGPGVDASHAHERTHKDALANTARLILAYLFS